MPYTPFADGELLTAATLNDRLVNQSVITVETLTELNAITAQEGMLVFLKSTNTYYVRKGGAWVITLEDTGWKVVTLSNGWVQYAEPGATNGTAPRYRRVNGVVYLKGLIRSGATGADTVLFTLPTGYRPAEQHHFPAATSGSIGYFGVGGNGQVLFKFGSSTWFSLDGASWVAEG